MEIVLFSQCPRRLKPAHLSITSSVNCTSGLQLTLFPQKKWQLKVIQWQVLLPIHMVYRYHYSPEKTITRNHSVTSSVNCTRRLPLCYFPKKDEHYKSVTSSVNGTRGPPLTLFHQKKQQLKIIQSQVALTVHAVFCLRYFPRRDGTG